MFHYSNKEVNDLGEKVPDEKEKLEIPSLPMNEVCSKIGTFFQIFINSENIRRESTELRNRQSPPPPTPPHDC